MLYVLIIIVVIVVAIVITGQRNIARNKKMEQESFKYPRGLSINDAGSIFKVVDISSGKIQLSVMELHTHYEGNDEIEELISKYWVNFWYLEKNIPSDFQNIGAIFETKNQKGQLAFNRYHGVIKKVTHIAFDGGARTTKELIEV